MNETLKVLTSHNLLSYDAESKSYSIHRLVQETIQLQHGGSMMESVLPVLIDSGENDFFFLSDEGGPLAVEKR